MNLVTIVFQNVLYLRNIFIICIGYKLWVLMVCDAEFPSKFLYFLCVKNYVFCFVLLGKYGLNNYSDVTKM